MKILQVYHIFPALYGGVSTVVYQITKELSQRGHKIDILTTNAHLGRKESNNPHGISVYRFPLFIKKLATNYNIVLPKVGFISWVKENVESYDCIHLHGYWNLYSVIVANYAKKYNVPYVLQTHGSLPRIMAWRRLKWIYDVLFGYRLLRDASKVVALSRVEAEQYRRMGVPDEKIKVVPNGIDLSEYADLPSKGSFKKKFNIDKDEKIVLYVGRIHQSKGLDLLAESFSIIARKMKKIRLVVVGPDDGYATEFSRLISRLGIGEKVLLTGFVEKRDKLAALVDSEVFVTPRFHGFPITFLEACLAGCPIVTTSDELNWIHDNVGYVITNSPVALARATSKILQDEQLRKRFHNSCARTIQNFEISTVTRQLEDTYKDAVNRTVASEMQNCTVAVKFL